MSIVNLRNIITFTKQGELYEFFVCMVFSASPFHRPYWVQILCLVLQLQTLVVNVTA
jgi:hypothetical protein